MDDKIKQYYNPLLGYINKRVKNPLDAEDIIQDVFLKLANSDLDKVNNFKSWVYRITKNAIIDHYRTKKIDISSIETHFIEEENEENDVIYELSECLIPFIEELADDYATILKLSEIEGISQKEIAVKLNMNYVTVRSKVQRGRVILKGLFSKCCTIEQGGRGSIICYNNMNSCC